VIWLTDLLRRLGVVPTDVPADDPALLRAALADLRPGTLRPDEAPLLLDQLALALNAAHRAHWDALAALRADDLVDARQHACTAADLLVASDVLRTLTQLPRSDLTRDTRQQLAAVAGQRDDLAATLAQADAAELAQLQQVIGAALTVIATHHGAADEAAQRGAVFAAQLQWCGAAAGLITIAQALDDLSARDAAQVDALLRRFGPWLRAVLAQVEDGLERSGVADADDHARRTSCCGRCWRCPNPQGMPRACFPRERNALSLRPPRRRDGALGHALRAAWYGLWPRCMRKQRPRRHRFSAGLV